MYRLFDCFIQHRLVFNDFGYFDAAGCRHDDLGFGIFDAHRQFVRRKTAKHHGVNGAKAGNGIHGDQGFRHHGHVDDDTIALLDALRLEYTRKLGHLIAHFAIGQHSLAVCNWRVVDDSRLIGTTIFDMVIQCHIGGVHLTISEPAINTVFIFG